MADRALRVLEGGFPAQSFEFLFASLWQFPDRVTVARAIVLDKKRRVLLVEDEPLVTMMLEDMLLDADCEIVGTASSLQTGMALANSCTMDLAILDMTLGRESSFPIADILAAKGVPFLFVSGYGRESLPEGHRQCVVLTKPFDYDQLVESIDMATNAIPGSELRDAAG